MLPTRLVYLASSIILSSFCLFAVAEDNASITAAPSLPKAPTSSPSNTSIPFSSAVLIEVSVSSELHSVPTPAIPLPTNATKYPQYDAIRQFLPAMPIVQAGIQYPEPKDLITDLMSPSNTSKHNSLTKRQSAMRVLIVGDSISQGQEGDWTWRYRIWQWFRQNSVAVKMVGPYSGTKAPPPPAPQEAPALYGAPAKSLPYSTNGGYAKGVDAGFLSNTNHFAVWGRAAAVSKGLIGSVLQQNNADLMLLMLGFNDVGWFYSDGKGAIASIQELITNARAANPNLKIAVANIPQRSSIGGRDDLIQKTNEFNQLLPGIVSQMSTSQSPIHVVDIAGTYDCKPAACPSGKQHVWNGSSNLYG